MSDKTLSEIEEYNGLLKTGMFWEFYPQLSLLLFSKKILTFPAATKKSICGVPCFSLSGWWVWFTVRRTFLRLTAGDL